jgi:hypothetical protein
MHKHDNDVKTISLSVIKGGFYFREALMILKGIILQEVVSKLDYISSFFI